MKSLSPREMRLAKISAACLLAGVSYFILDHQLNTYKDIKEQTLSVGLESARQNEWIERQPELWDQLETIRGQLPVYPESKDLKPQFARQVEALSSISGLQLTAVTPRPEEFLEDLGLYQSTFRCKWKGTSQQLIHTLVEVQKLGIVADIRELLIQNRTGQSDELTGTFVLDFIYTRNPDIRSGDTSEGPPS